MQPGSVGFTTSARCPPQAGSWRPLVSASPSQSAVVLRQASGTPTALERHAVPRAEGEGNSERLAGGRRAAWRLWLLAAHQRADPDRPELAGRAGSARLSW